MTDLQDTPTYTSHEGEVNTNPKTIPTDVRTKQAFAAACAQGGLTQKDGIKLAVGLLAKRVASERVETPAQKIERMLSES